MADIAILVAEEYGRRVNISRKNGENIDFFSCVAVLGQRIEAGSSSWMKKKLKDEKLMEFLQIKGFLLEPKSQMSLAASNGLFSA